MHFLELHEIATLIRRGEVTSSEVTEAMLERIDRYDAHLSSFSDVLADSARKEAEDRDSRYGTGQELGALHGVPIAVKDLFAVTGTPTSAGTLAFADRIAAFDATVVRRLRSAGAVIVGKLKMSEGAFAAHHPQLGTPRNPWGDHLWVGASSSGNAAATSAGLCYASIGSDTGGSIRFPSAATGLSGLKPTWGRVSRAGMAGFARSLDCPGPMARSVRDCAIVHDAISGPDPEDPVTLQRPGSRLTEACEHAEAVVDGARIGIDPSFMALCDTETRDMILAAAAVFESLGAELVEVALPPVEQIVDDWTPACAVEAALEHEDVFRRSPAVYGSQLSELIAQGLATSGADYQRILDRRHDFSGRVRQAFAGIDALLLQVTGIAGPTAEYLDEIGVGAEWRTRIMMATCPINSAGLPAMTVPGGITDSGAPIGFQIVGACDREATIVALAQAFQRHTDHHRRHPSAYV